MLDFVPREIAIVLKIGETEQCVLSAYAAF